MRYIHTKCQGTIDLKKRQCTRCKKKWNRFGIWFDPTGIRSVSEPGDYRKVTRQEELTSLQEGIRNKIPGGKYAVGFASLLPKWPRWARVLTVAVILGLIGWGISLIIR